MKSTTRHENTKVIAMITGVSLARIEVMSRDPMPGTRKICSVITAPVKMPGICRATRVTTGIRAFRTACFQIVTFSERPLERAVLM